MNLYHGTTKENALKLLENGWAPFQVSSGANGGNPKFLYVTNEPENALWFAEQKGDNVVLEICDLDVDALKVDPEDGTGETVSEELFLSSKTKCPAYLVAFKPISADKIRLFMGSV